jgi:cysteinyl-tRNA synthetase
MITGGGAALTRLSRMSLRLYDTRTRAIREFAPLREGVVGIYICGPTVQSSPHIGHMRTSVGMDVLRRWLTASGYAVELVQNVTDIDDKILRNSEAAGEPWWALATRVTREFNAAYLALNVIPPTGEPRATGHVTEMVALMQRLIDRGHGYAAGGDVYFDVRSWPAYGELSGQRIDAMQSTEDPGAKRDALDFTLWKGAKPGEPSWQTPWGPGRPGWHLECSAMATRYLGPMFDIHGGGLDLVFPHHENELAQSRAAGDEYARFWMHGGLLTTGGDKMGKSSGNSLFVPDLLAEHGAPALRYALSSAHYRSVSEWSTDGIIEAGAAYSRIAGFLQRAAERVGDPPGDAPVPPAFAEAMDDDLAVSAALGVLHDEVRRGNNALAAGDGAGLTEAAGSVAAMTKVLGLWPGDFEAAAAGGLAPVVDALVPALLATRQAARDRKDFAESDRIRDALVAAGVLVEDTPDGPRWRVQT